MRVVFVSNYYNHHQSELSKTFFEETNGQYTFIQTEALSEEREKLGWGMELPEFVIKSYESSENYEKAMNLICEADVVIFGEAPMKMMHKRIKEGKLTFRYTERIFKKKDFDLGRLIKYTFRYLPYRRKNLYFLCSSGYAAKDYIRCGVDIKKCFKWGYFPEIIKYGDIAKLTGKKKENTILWCGRIIGLKHPEIAIEIAKRLKKDGMTFSLNIIGTGNMETEIKRQIVEENLSDCVNMPGRMPPSEVRRYMEESEIFLFTSDRNEGWGAVLNEAMNSACAVVANEKIGSVPYLLKSEYNGLVCESGREEEYYKKVKWLLENKEKGKLLGESAYDTLREIWNADTAGKRLISLAERIINGDEWAVYDDGPCSFA